MIQIPETRENYMTKAELERTTWAKEFKADSPVSYTEAIWLAMDPNLRVVVHRSYRAGEMVWAIDVDKLYPGFLMDVRPTKKAALELCKKMGWKVAPSTPKTKRRESNAI